MYRSGRRPWKSGKWLVQDEESGVICYSDNITRDYLGRLVRPKYADSEHPQDFVVGLDDPKPLPFTRPVPIAAGICGNQFTSIYVGDTAVIAKRDGPADHLFEGGIGEMEIGCSFIIYPEST